MTIVECVPNISEGRRQEVVDACADAIRQGGSALLDIHVDAAHNRSVFTFAGSPAKVKTSALALVQTALAAIDLRHHAGVHPRLGAVDVLPFVPLQGATLDDCVSLARDVAFDVAQHHHVPIYLYEAAASTPSRSRLEDIRRGQFEGLAEKMRQQEWAPDFGPSLPHPSAGAMAVGARWPLIAFNINLATDRLEVAKAIASTIRERSGGLRAVKALGLPLVDRGIVQVSMNLTNFRETSLDQAFESVAREAARHGVSVLESEIVGLVPAEALAGPGAARLQVAGFTPRMLIEHQLLALDVVG
jgi:glutamate formiminotransferase